MLYLLPYKELLSEYYQERDRICHDFNDEFIVNEETIHALDELTEKYRKKAQHIGQDNLTELNKL